METPPRREGRRSCSSSQEPLPPETCDGSGSQDGHSPIHHSSLVQPLLHLEPSARSPPCRRLYPVMYGDLVSFLSGAPAPPVPAQLWTREVCSEPLPAKMPSSCRTRSQAASCMKSCLISSHWSLGCSGPQGLACPALVTETDGSGGREGGRHLQAPTATCDS